MTRAGGALRQQWAQEAAHAAIMRDPARRAAYLAEQARLDRRSRALQRYGRMLRAAYRDGRLTAEQTLECWLHAEDRTARTLHRWREGQR